MSLSVFDLFKIGVGPSSSHTVGPMKAACEFARKISSSESIIQIQVELYGSLALTGKGHGTDLAVMLGLEGNHPATVDPELLSSRPSQIEAAQSIMIAGRPVPFAPQADIVFKQSERLPHHTNGMRFVAQTSSGAITRDYYSIGGGFVVDEGGDPIDLGGTAGPARFPFRTAEELLEHCRRERCSIAQLMRMNEVSARSETELSAGLMQIWSVMQQCINRGLHSHAVELPGGLGVRRRAPGMRAKLEQQGISEFVTLDRLNLYAIAVGEENASLGRVVTAPTNGAAGIIPAVLAYYRWHTSKASDTDVEDFLLTAAAIGILYKEGASISGAEMGCQGEVGVACSMAAAGFAAVMGGTIEQVENAAEIGMEHCLGLTCDPIGGLVQIPCIERNAVGAVKAVDAARLAMQSDGQHVVSLDRAIVAMKKTGEDMLTKYKETSQGGLAVAVTQAEC